MSQKQGGAEGVNTVEEKNDGKEVNVDYRSAYQKQNAAKTPKKNGQAKKQPVPQKSKNTSQKEAPAQKKSQQPKKQQPSKVTEKPKQNQEPKVPVERDDFLTEDEKEIVQQEEKKIIDGVSLPSEDEKPVKKRPRKRRYGIFVGSIVMIFALIGVCFLVGTVGKQIYFSLTDDSKLREYDTFLSPIVMQDPAPFDDPEQADPQMVLNASVWRAVTLNGMEYSDYDELGRTLVPLADVADACHELFGPDCDLQPENPEEETFFEYDAEKYMFHVAPYSSQSSFAPYTVSSRSSGGNTILRVGYVAASDEWRSDTTSQVQTPTPTKYMEYVLSTNTETGKEYVSAIHVAGEES